MAKRCAPGESWLPSTSTRAARYRVCLSDRQRSRRLLHAGRPNVHKAFFRSPVEFRISSGFSLGANPSDTATHGAHTKGWTTPPSRAPRSRSRLTAVSFAGSQGRLRQRDHRRSPQGRSPPFTTTCPLCQQAETRGSHVQRARGDRLRRHDRLGHRPAFALRIPRGRRAPRSGARRVALRQCRSVPSRTSRLSAVKAAVA